MFKLKMVLKSDNGEYVEHESFHKTHDDALEEADDVAFSTTGFGIESWKYIASFGEEGGLYYFYPIEGISTTKYVIRILRATI